MSGGAPLFCAVVALAACGGADPCAPIYGGAATDEAWRTLVDGEPRAQAGQAESPVITFPSEGQALSAADAPPRVTWSSTLSWVPARRPAPATRLARVRRWLGGLVERRAEAHLPPVTGAVHHLRVDIPGRSCAYTVVTTEKAWQIDDAAWAAMKAANGQPIAIRMTSAYLTENRITEGPFSLGVPRTFSVR